MKKPEYSHEFLGGSNMGLLSVFFDNKPKTAATARERLQIIIAHERNIDSGPDFMPALRQELIAVISKYTQVSPADINISLDKKGHLEVLDVNVVLPDGGAAR
jgi:cell division topological specificity factor